MKTCEETHELCCDMVYYGMEGTLYRVLCVAAVEALRLFFSRKELCRGWGVCCHTFYFVLFSAV